MWTGWPTLPLVIIPARSQRISYPMSLGLIPTFDPIHLKGNKQQKHSFIYPVDIYQGTFLSFLVHHDSVCLLPTLSGGCILPQIRTKSGIGVPLYMCHSSLFLFSPHPIESGTHIKRTLSWWPWEIPGPCFFFLYDPINRLMGGDHTREPSARISHWQMQNTCLLSQGCGTSFIHAGQLNLV